MIDPKLQKYADECLAKGAPKTRYVATALTGLYKTPSFFEELLTQVTRGAELEVLEERDPWCFVRQHDGYLGWAYASYLSEITPPVPTHLVATPLMSVVREIDSNDPPAIRLSGGTSVAIAESLSGWSKIESLGWARDGELRSLKALPLAPAEAREQIIADARRFTGIYYQWGANSAFGTDCSGLAQLTHLLSGYTLPRDANMQFPAGVPVDAPYRAGDLLFFHSETNPDKITHVGISTGGWNMIHSSRSRNGVYEEDVQKVDHLRESFAGARTFLK